MLIKTKGIAVMEEGQRDGLEIKQESEKETEQETVQIEEQKTKSSGGSLFEGIYDQLPDISVKAVDRFILICAIALVAVILIGVLKANHIF